jgi:hypothetical protein
MILEVFGMRGFFYFLLLSFLLSFYAACEGRFPQGELIILPDAPPRTEVLKEQAPTEPSQESAHPEDAAPEVVASESSEEAHPTEEIAKESLPEESLPEEQITPEESAPEEVTLEKQPESPPPDLPLPSRIALHIGDSQSSGTQFARIMVDLLREPSKYCSKVHSRQNAVFSYGRVSSASRHWSEQSGSSKDWLCSQTTFYTNGTAAQNTTGAAMCSGITQIQRSVFEQRILLHKPSIFLIQLGGNSMGFSESFVKSRIQRMLDQMPLGSLCFWVTPSLKSQQYDVRNRDIERWTVETLQAYTRLTCYPLTSIQEMSQQTTCSSFNTSDGVHLTSCASQLWGQFIAQKLCALDKL